MKSISTLIVFPHFHIIGFPHFYITVVQVVWQVVAHPLLPMSGSHFSQGWLGSLFTSQIISSQAPRPTLSENLTMTVNIASLNIHFHFHFSTFLCISLHLTFYISGQFDGAYRRPMDAIFSFIRTFLPLPTCLEYFIFRK